MAEATIPKQGAGSEAPWPATLPAEPQPTEPRGYAWLNRTAALAEKLATLICAGEPVAEHTKLAIKHALTDCLYDEIGGDDLVRVLEAWAWAADFETLLPIQAVR